MNSCIGFSQSRLSALLFSTLLLMWLLFHSSVQLCKDLTEKTQHGNEIRGKIRVLPVYLCLYLLFTNANICELLM